METHRESQVRDLAYHVWESAGREYGKTLDFWLMAEQMVLELVTATARLAGSAVGAQRAVADVSHMRLKALYLDRVHELSYHMWESAGYQYGKAMDFWLAAENHAMTVLSAIMKVSSAAALRDDTIARLFAAFSPAAHIERIRKTAYFMWEEAGRQYGDALEFWLLAEKKVLNEVVEEIERTVQASAGGAAADIPPEPAGEVTVSPPPSPAIADDADATSGAGTNGAAAPNGAPGTAAPGSDDPSAPAPGEPAPKGTPRRPRSPKKLAS